MYKRIKVNNFVHQPQYTENKSSRQNHIHLVLVKITLYTHPSPQPFKTSPNDRSNRRKKGAL